MPPRRNPPDTSAILPLQLHSPAGTCPTCKHRPESNPVPGNPCNQAYGNQISDHCQKITSCQQHEHQEKSTDHSARKSSCCLRQIPEIRLKPDEKNDIKSKHHHGKHQPQQSIPVIQTAAGIRPVFPRHTQQKRCSQTQNDLSVQLSVGNPVILSEFHWLFSFLFRSFSRIRCSFRAYSGRIFLIRKGSRQTPSPLATPR